jgi:poly(A) polymerase
VGGREDIDAKIVRAIGDPNARFAEDHLRMLRAIRFAARFGFEIEPETWAAIKVGAPLLKKISAERTRDEMSKILLDDNRVRGFDLLVESGLMEQIVPEILVLKGCEQPPQFHPEGDVFVHTRLMLSLLELDAPSLALVWSVLLHDIGKPATYTFEEGDRIRFNGHDKVGAEMAEVILRRMKYPNELIDDVCIMVLNHMVFKDVQKMRTSKVKRMMARGTFSDEMELHRVDCLGSWGGLDNYDFLNTKAEEFANAPIIPPRLIDGKDLLERGWHAGPAMGKTLREIQDLQLEGKLATKEEALGWLATKSP